MDITDPDLTPSGGSFTRPVISRRQVVGQFSAPAYVHPDDLWQPLTRTNDVTRDGQQGSPFGYQPGRAIEHEPLDQDERDSEKTAQRAYSFHEAADQIRSALRPGSLAF